MSSAKRVLSSFVGANLALIIFATVLGLLSKNANPSRYFGEGRFTTGASCLQLLLIAFFSARIFLLRRSGPPTAGFRASYWVWALMAAGFVFLAADDALKLHEHLDSWLLKTFAIEKTPFTDRLDDLLIALYGLIGAAVLWLCRHELLSLKVILPPLGAGFVCLFISVLGDTLSNGETLLLWLTGGDLPLAKRLDGWFSVVDGAFTLLAEGFFAAGFCAGWLQAREEARVVTVPAPTVSL